MIFTLIFCCLTILHFGCILLKDIELQTNQRKLTNKPPQRISLHRYSITESGQNNFLPRQDEDEVPGIRNKIKISLKIQHHIYNPKFVIIKCQCVDQCSIWMMISFYIKSFGMDSENVILRLTIFQNRFCRPLPSRPQ